MGRSRKNRTRRESAGAVADREAWWAPVVPLAGLAAIAALTLVAPLHPTEVAARTGSEAPLMIAWIGIAFAGACWQTVRAGRSAIVGGWVLCWVWLAVILIVLSGLVAGPAGHFRLVANAMGQWVAVAVSVTLMASVLQRAEFQRVIVVVGLAVAVTSALYGIYEWMWIHPEIVRQFERNPEAVMRQAGVIAEPGSVAWRQFEDRLHSTEPFATFGLPNSLAGFVATWLVVAAGILLAELRRGRRIVWLVALLASLIVLAFCLWLTKSRTAILATLIGLLGLAISYRGRWSSRTVFWASGGVIAAMVAGFVALAWVDPLVVAEAPLSVRYRLEYWAGCVRLALDHPWFGCGVGNFQAFYPRYMQPWSSETVADPHNFWFELLACGGIPAALIALPLIRNVIALARATDGAEDGESARQDGQAADLSGTAVFVGAIAGVAAGVVGAVFYSLTQGRFPDLLLVALVAIISALLLAAATAWLKQGRLPRSAIGWGLATWGINACAAGAIGYWGVAHSFWLLLAIWCASSRPVRGRLEDPTSGLKRHEVSRWWWGVASIGLALAALGVFRLIYRPVTLARAALLEANSGYTRSEVERAYLAAAEADRWWGLPWERLAELRHGEYMASRDHRSWERFQQACREATGRDRHSAPLYIRIGNWNLVALWQVDGGRGRGVAEMLRAYRRAVELHPADAFYHAQLAWAYHLAGEGQLAAEEAKQALRLDAQVPHEELKLANRRLVEGLEAATTTAERRMEQLRSKTVSGAETALKAKTSHRFGN